MANDLFIKKSIKTLLSHAADRRHGLSRTLGPWQLTAIGVGGTVGAGLFVIVGQAAAECAGPAVLLSFLLAAIICALAAFCYAELASVIPVAGSAYSYAYVTMGECIAWTVGWALVLEYLFSASTVAVGWSGYMVELLQNCHLQIPDQIAKAPLLYHATTGWQSSGAWINLPAVIIVALMGGLVATGVRIASVFNTIVVLIKMGVILVFIGCGIAFVSSSNWVPFIPPNSGVFGEFGFSGILRGAGVVFFAFIGFDAVSTLSQEARHSQKDVATGMLRSLGISTVAYIVFALVLTGVVSYQVLGVPDPVAIAVNVFGPSFVWVSLLIKIAIVVGLTSVILVMLLGQSRIFFMMAQDGLLPRLFAQVDPKSHAPFYGAWATTLVGMLVAGFFPVEILGQLVSLGTLLIFAIVCFSVLVLRYTQPHLHRPFKTPFVPWVPLVGTIACIVQMCALSSVAWLQLMVWMSLGYWIYFVYGMKHSLARLSAKPRPRNSRR